MLTLTPHLPDDSAEQQYDQGSLVVEAIERQRRPVIETVSPWPSRRSAVITASAYAVTRGGGEG
jgi:hypothetical protein